MPRSKIFHPLHEPLRSQDSLELQHEHVGGPFSFMNPTRAHYRHSALPPQSTLPLYLPDGSRDGTDTEKPPHNDERYASKVEFKWRSRDNRKGRHTLLVDPSDDSGKYITPKPTTTLGAAGQGILRMVTQYPYWDVSYLVAIIFTLGSVVWVINAFFAWLPFVRPSTDFHNEVLYGGGITAFIGATIFEIGSVLLMFEAVNENRGGCFGWALEKVLEGDGRRGGKVRITADKDGCSHHHTNKHNLVGKPDARASSQDSNIAHSNSSGDLPIEKSMHTNDDAKSWLWFPSTHDLLTHYFREIGFLASFAQFCGASIFWISGFTALPGINNKMSQRLLDGIYWTPQIVGGTGFIISGILFMLETQSKWYIPAPKVLGWHIGLWNLIGAFGFTLCGALGPAYGNTGAQYEASLATFWGSWAFLIGSLVQWYECLDTHPVEERGRDAPT